jgi:predicted Na+-dependent transporter
MAERLSREFVAARAIVHEAPQLRAPTTVDRSFELPARSSSARPAATSRSLAVMAFGFGNPQLILPMAIFVTFIVMAFAVPAMWMRMKPDHPQALTSWSRFSRRGS